LGVLESVSQQLMDLPSPSAQQTIEARIFSPRSPQAEPPDSPSPAPSKNILSSFVDSFLKTFTGTKVHP
jgi:hypothetical protein